jgi:hypothetical protein
MAATDRETAAWRSLARGARASAGRVRDMPTKRAMLAIAELCDAMAATRERRDLVLRLYPPRRHGADTSLGGSATPPAVCNN